MLSLGMLVAWRNASVTDPHPRQRNANPRWRDVAAYTASVTHRPLQWRAVGGADDSVSRTIVLGHFGRWPGSGLAAQIRDSRTTPSKAGT
jgi:hypothetical protein